MITTADAENATLADVKRGMVLRETKDMTKYLGLSGVLAFLVRDRRALAFSAETKGMPEMDAESLTLSRTETK